VDPLTAAGAVLATVHFTTPLAYYATAKRWLRLPWGVRRDASYTPTVTIPTYNVVKRLKGGKRVQTYWCGER